MQQSPHRQHQQAKSEIQHEPRTQQLLLLLPLKSSGQLQQLLLQQPS
jgi:hypothetical protein